VVACGRKPSATETTATPAVATIVVSMLLMTCAARIATRDTGIVRKRSTTPSVMSTHTATAVAMLPEATAVMMMPGAM
jgi:hypothetical protein